MDDSLLNTTNRYVTLAEAAALLSVSKATLRNWDKAGKLTAIRHPLNSYRLYDFAELKSLQQQLGMLFPPEEPLPYASEALDTKTVRRLISRLHSILRNTDSQSNIISRFDEITKLLVCKVMADRSKALGKVSPFEVHGEITDAAPIRLFYAEIAEQFKELFLKRFTKFHASDRSIVECANLLRLFDFDATNFDVKGLAYEEIIRNTFDKGDHQQFFTPPHIVDFIISMCAQFIHGDVCDPASGTGGFLASIAHRDLDYNSLTSIEIDERLSWVSGINMLLHGGRSISTIYLPEGGTLGQEASKYFSSFDTIITNPPFGSDFTDPAALTAFTLGHGKPSRRRGILFIERCHNLLRDKGTLAIILDEGVLNLGHATDVRHFLTDKFDLKAVVSLPETAFMPYATVNASILILTKRVSSDSNHAVFFAKADAVGRKTNGDDDIQYNRDGTSQLNSDLPFILKEWQSCCAGSELAETANIYVADVRSNLANNANGYRLDYQYHHPSRQISQGLIARCIYPLRRLGDICTERSNMIVPSKQLTDTIIRYTGLANIEAKLGVAEQVATPANSLKSAVKVYHRGDIVFAKMRPNLRKVALMDFPETGYVSPECVVLTMKNAGNGIPILDPLILSILLRSDFVYGQIMHHIAGIGRPRIGVKELREVMIPIPPKELQNRIKSDFMNRHAAAEQLKSDAQAMLSRAEVILHDAINILARDFVADEASNERR